jgi:hypothetical protein
MSDTATLSVPLLDVQYRFLVSVVKFICLLTGVGYGKTWIGARKAVAKAVNHPGTKGLACSNSYRQLEDVVIPELRAALEQMGVSYTWRAGDRNFILENGSIIQCRSLQSSAIDGLRGTSFEWAWLDEARDMPEKAFEVVQSRVGRKIGPVPQVFITTTPAGFNWIYKRFGPNRKNKDQYEIFRASTRDNPFLPDNFYGDLEDSYSKEFAEQELEGGFISMGKRLYSSWHPIKNVTKKARYRAGDPLIVALDFNIGHCVAAIMQERGGCTLVVDEIFCDKGEGTFGVIDEFMRKYPQAQNVFIYGDPAGHGRNAAASKTNYELWREALPDARVMVPTSWYPIPDRVLSVNYRLCSAREKKRRLFVNPSCTHVIEDFDQVAPQKDGSCAPLKSNDTLHLTHISDAIGYYVVHEHSVRARVNGIKQAMKDAEHRFARS